MTVDVSKSKVSDAKGETFKLVKVEASDRYALKRRDQSARCHAAPLFALKQPSESQTFVADYGNSWSK